MFFQLGNGYKMSEEKKEMETQMWDDIELIPPVYVDFLAPEEEERQELVRQEALKALLARIGPKQEAVGTDQGSAVSLRK